MVDLALVFLTDELNTFIASRMGPGLRADLTRIVDDAGRYVLTEPIGVHLIAVEEERAFRAQLPTVTHVNGRDIMQQPELQLNLYVLVAANNTTYRVALGHLALVLTFFQAHSVFTADQYPALDARIAKLTVELMSLSFEQLNQVWAAIGAKQLPSVVYKVRTVVVQDVEPAGIQIPITSINSALLQR
ncbi:MAG TPA: Pvc16 family protein [Longimicrobiales bacterium]|nr:Pvc16 family protein [Longimicrobiales bacterium]